MDWKLPYQSINRTVVLAELCSTADASAGHYIFSVANQHNRILVHINFLDGKLVHGRNQSELIAK
jgi:hypothetical protein